MKQIIAALHKYLCVSLQGHSPGHTGSQNGGPFTSYVYQGVRCYDMPWSEVKCLVLFQNVNALLMITVILSMLPEASLALYLQIMQKKRDMDGVYNRAFPALNFHCGSS